MIKIIFLLVTANAVLSAPGVPFLQYGLPALPSNSEEKNVPSFDNRVQEEIPEFSSAGNVVEEVELHPVENSPNPGSPLRPANGFGTPYHPGPFSGYDQPAYDLELPQHEFNHDFRLPEDYFYVGYAPDFEIGSEQDSPGTDLNEQPLFETNEGSEIKETEIAPITDFSSPQDTRNPEESFNGGQEIQDSFVDESKNPISPNFETPDKLVLTPGKKIKIQDASGQYSHGFANPDGTEVQESGHLISTDDGWEYVIAKEGSYSYVSPEGYPIHVRYIADHRGFRVLGVEGFGRR
ncbi:uncharacterized protein LOC125501692 [Athalia rosae]|uniref:uncharacterized protein LOC125501692 n=1 Tax=Athalia rosae TaxID=37344 RepID=UPI0020349893|nr:uncharacterized protein LOC125501692 [Athalia rosae]